MMDQPAYRALEAILEASQDPRRLAEISTIARLALATHMVPEIPRQWHCNTHDRAVAHGAWGCDECSREVAMLGSTAKVTECAK